jgi:hypothetical protein
MFKTPHLVSGFFVFILICLWGCAPQETASLSFGFRFSTSEFAQSSSGLPSDVYGLRVDVFSGSLSGTPVSNTGCMALGSSATQRESVSLNVDAGVFHVMVQGWNNNDCSEEPQWRGVARGVQVSVGAESQVNIFVTRRGWRLNPIRGRLSSARAFATATPLADGRVLIAGGFDQVNTRPSAVLQAACDAMIYNPGTATIERTFGLGGPCRGLHQALVLPDGKVMLVGGCGQAILDKGGVTRPLLRPDVNSLLSSVDIFDPATEQFSASSVTIALTRAATAAVLVDGRIVLLGGRTRQLRSDDIVLGTLVDGVWQWQVSGKSMISARASARAVSTDQGLLVIGGNPAGGVAMEIVDLTTLVAKTLTCSGAGSFDLSLSGHGLVSFDSSSFLLSGGLLNAPGTIPSSQMITGSFAGESCSLQANDMLRYRAYHSVVYVPGLSSDEAGYLFVGGLNQHFVSNHDCEKILPSQEGRLIQDPLQVGAVGVAGAVLNDGSVLLVGGLDVNAEGTVTLSADGQILTP